MTDRSKSTSLDGISTGSIPGAGSSSRLVKAMIRQAVEDAAKGRGKRQREALAYLSSREFNDDCRSVGIDPRHIARLVIALLDLPEAERAEEMTRIKALVRA